MLAYHSIKKEQAARLCAHRYEMVGDRRNERGRSYHLIQHSAMYYSLLRDIPHAELLIQSTAHENLVVLRRGGGT